MNRETVRTLRAAQSDLLQSVADAMQTAYSGPFPDKLPGEWDSHYSDRLENLLGFEFFDLPGGRARVLRHVDRLAAFAGKVKRSQGFGAARARAIGRDGGTGVHVPKPSSLGAAQSAYGHFSDDSLHVKQITKQAAIVDRLRAAAVGAANGCDYPADERNADAGDMEQLQREMVRRGLLDATDWDKVNGDPVLETDAEPAQEAAAPLFDAVDALPVPQPAKPARMRWDIAAGAWAPVQAASVESDPPVPVQPVDAHGRRALPAPVEVAGRVHKYRIRLNYFWLIPVNDFNRKTHAEASWIVEKLTPWQSWKEIECDAVPVTIARKAARMVDEFNAMPPVRPAAIEADPPVPVQAIESTPPVPSYREAIAIERKVGAVRATGPAMAAGYAELCMQVHRVSSPEPFYRHFLGLDDAGILSEYMRFAREPCAALEVVLNSHRAKNTHRQREFCGTQVPATAQNSRTATRRRLRWRASAAGGGIWWDSTACDWVLPAGARVAADAAA